MSRRNTELLLLIASAFPVILLYAMYVLTAGAAISFETLAVPIGLFAAFAAAHIAVRILAPGADPAILPIVFVLSGIGITFVTRLAPALAISQLIILFVSVALMVGTLALVKNLDVVMRYKYTFGIIGIILLMLPIFIGTTISGSKLWIRIAGFTIQPGEFAKVFIVLFLAGYLAENRELLSISNRKILGFKIPRLRLLLPLFAVWGVCLLVVVFERDLGSAVLFYTIFLLMLYVATGRFSYVVIGLALLAVGAVGAYKFLSHVQVRFQVWVDPFKDAQGQGYQIVQSLFSLADGGLVGVGIGNGMANNIPVVESDFIFSAIGEEMGLLGARCVQCRAAAGRPARVGAQTTGDSGRGRGAPDVFWRGARLCRRAHHRRGFGRRVHGTRDGRIRSGARRLCAGGNALAGHRLPSRDGALFLCVAARGWRACCRCRVGRRAVRRLF